MVTVRSRATSVADTGHRTVTTHSHDAQPGDTAPRFGPDATVHLRGLRLDRRASRAPGPGPQGGPDGRRPVWAGQRLVDQRLLPRALPGAGGARLDRDDLAGRARRRRAPADRAADRGGGDDRRWRTDRGVVVRRPADGAGLDDLRHARTGRGVPASDPGRRDDLVHRDERARCRLGPGRAQDERGARGRRARHQRAEDLDELRRGGRLLLPDLSHVSGRSTARRHQRGHRADVQRRHRGATDRGHDHQPPLLRGLLQRRAGAGDQPRRRGGRSLQADHAPARARAGGHRSADLELRPLSRRRGPERTPPTVGSARRWPASRPATDWAGCW